MPYYLFKITTLPFKQLELLGQFDGFRDASARAKELRATLSPSDPQAIKVMFGDNQLQAEDLLNQEREPQPMTGEDY